VAQIFPAESFSDKGIGAVRRQDANTAMALEYHCQYARGGFHAFAEVLPKYILQFILEMLK